MLQHVQLSVSSETCIAFLFSPIAYGYQESHFLETEGGIKSTILLGSDFQLETTNMNWRFIGKTKVLKNE